MKTTARAWSMAIVIAGSAVLGAPLAVAAPSDSPMYPSPTVPTSTLGTSTLGTDTLSTLSNSSKSELSGLVKDVASELTTPNKAVTQPLQNKPVKPLDKSVPGAGARVFDTIFELLKKVAAKAID